MLRRRSSSRLSVPLCAAGLLVLLGVATPIRAQVDEVRVTMVASSDAPSIGEQFQIQIEARLAGNSIGQLEPPDFGGLRVIGQSGVMRSQSIQQVFGSRPRIQIRESIVYAVVAEREGVYTVRPARFRTGRRTFESDPLIVKVEGGGPAATPPSASPQAAAGDSATFDSNAFVRAVVDRTEAYVGEQITLTVYLYVNDQLPVSNAQMQRAPSTTDFWVHDLRSPQAGSQREHQVVRGVGFDVHVIRRLALFPLRAGTLEAGATEMRLEMGNMLSLFTGRGSNELLTSCPPIAITVRPLPADAPHGTLVGQATVTADVDRRSLRTGEALTLTATVRGRGSLRDVTFPTPTVAGLRFEPPTIEDSVDSPSDIVGGERRIRWQVVPVTPGRHLIPSIALPVFDPSSGQVAFVRTDPIPLDVSGSPIAEEEPDAGVATSVEDEDAESALEFGPASRTSELRRATRAWSGHPAYHPLLVSAPLLALGVLLARSVFRRLAERRARRTASPDHKKALAEARRALADGDAAKFYGAIASALHLALDAALATRTAGMTHVDLRRLLESRGADADLVARTVDELDAADFARFSAAGTAPDEMRLTLERTQALVERLGRTSLGSEGTS